MWEPGSWGPRPTLAPILAQAPGWTPTAGLYDTLLLLLPPLTCAPPPGREERRALEEKYDRLYAPLYDKRAEVVNGKAEAPENETGAAVLFGAPGPLA